MRRGKRSAGYGAGKIAMLAVCAVLVLALTFFATHQVYSWIVGAGEPTDGDTTSPGNAQMQSSQPQASGGQSGTDHAATTVRSLPEDLPGTPDPSATEPDTTEPEETEPEGELTEPETTEDEPEASETSEQTEAPVTEPATEPATEAGATAPPTTAPPTTAPPTTAPPTTAPETTVNPNVPVTNAHGIYSKAALMLDLETGETLFSLDADKQVYPASLSKIMTALVVIENNANLDRYVTITEDMLAGLAEAGASTAGFKVDETVTLSDLLHGLMLPSGADAANAVAVATAGSVSEFVKMMNQKASALGMNSTNFMNTHGLHDAKLISSCRDLATLLTYALDNTSFRRIFTTASYTTTATEQHPDGIRLANNMSTELAKNPLKRGRVIGNKTGFTTPAGQCLASLAVIDGREYILITVGAGNAGWNTQRYNMLDAIELYGRIGE